MNDFFVPMPSNSEKDFLASCIGNNRVDYLIDKCLIYGKYLYETNQYLNLTSIPAEQFWNKHICDCLLVLKEAPACFYGEMADVGCGAGMPSVPIAIACPDLHVTSIDSRGKKITFVKKAAELCGLKNLTAIHARANELITQERFKNFFHVITARAVSDAFTLIKECRKLLRSDGTLCIFRTEQQLSMELPELQKKKIKCSVTQTIELPDNSGGRLFLLITHL